MLIGHTSTGLELVNITRNDSMQGTCSPVPSLSTLASQALEEPVCSIMTWSINARDNHFYAFFLRQKQVDLTVSVHFLLLVQR